MAGTAIKSFFSNFKVVPVTVAVSALTVCTGFVKTVAEFKGTTLAFQETQQVINKTNAESLDRVSRSLEKVTDLAQSMEKQNAARDEWMKNAERRLQRLEDKR